MNTGRNIFSCLLELDTIYLIYKKIGISIINELDLVNLNYHIKALNNSIELLKGVGLIKLNDEFIKIKGDLNRDSFSEALKEGITSCYSTELNELLNCKKHYYDERALFFIHVSDIPLKLMGLLMLMEQLGEFERHGERVFISHIDSYKRFIQGKQIDIEELKKRLEKQEKLGAEAEHAVLEYERKKLVSMGINKEPVIISDVDVTAGYDILSYLFNSDIPNKYIEVKSCNNQSAFFISRNEVEVAREKGEAYFLYLYHRRTGEVLEIKNPYQIIFCEDDDWLYQADSYRVSRIIE